MYSIIIMASQNIRRIFFWFLVVFFLTTVPVVIFYTRGYRFSFEKGIFIYSGSVTIKSNPQKVNIYIDHEPAQSKKTNFINNSYHIDGIKPGEYLLEVSAPEYQTWSKKISIHSGISSEFWNVLLARNEYPVTNFYTSSLERFFPSANNKYIAFPQKNENEFAVSALNLDTALTERVFSSPDLQFTNDENENIEWSHNSQNIIIPTLQNQEKHYFIVNIDKKSAIDLKDLAQSENLERVRWDPSKNSFIFYVSEKNLYRMDIEHPEDKIQIAQNVASYDISGGNVYYFQLPNGIVYKTDLEGGSAEQITTSAPADMSDPGYRIIAYDEKRIAFINDNSHALFIWNQGDKDNYFKELSSEAKGIQFSDDGKKLLFWNGWEIFVYFTREWQVQPYRQENEVLDITRFSQEIQNVQWSKDYEHVVFSVDKKIKIAELDHRDRRNIMDIASLRSDSAKIVLNFTDSKLYFTDTPSENDSFFNLYSIDFPEKGGLLGG